MSTSKVLNITVGLIALIICYIAWPVISELGSKQLQPIASGVSTLAGILLGFIMASITILAAAQDNTLAKNTRMTGYFEILVGRLHVTMGALLLVCVVFLMVLFIPDTLTFKAGSPSETYRYSSILTLVGVFFLILAFSLFFRSWSQFKNFATHM